MPLNRMSVGLLASAMVALALAEPLQETLVSEQSQEHASVEINPRAWAAHAKPITIKGRSAWQSEPRKDATHERYFYFDIQDPLLKNGNAETVTITLTYLDQFHAPLVLHYDSTDASAGAAKQGKSITTGDSGEWKQISWTLDDAAFKSRCLVHDFRILIGANVDFVIAECTVSGTPKQTLILPNVFSSHMVLQRNVPVPVWGTAADGTAVTVSFNGYHLKSTARDGRWKIVLPPMSASAKPQEMTVTAKRDSKLVTRRFSNVLVGDVWLASGQSNMAMHLGSVKGAEEAIARSANPLLRFFTVSCLLENTVPPLGADWETSTPSSAAPMSAVAYFFAQEIQQTQDIPVGLIHCSYGGTVTEAWCSPDVLKESYPVWEDFEAKMLKTPDWYRKNTSSRLYSRMLQTVIPFPVKGFIWYQGESNAGRSQEQKKLFPAMVKDWRERWGDADLPFYFVQLARFDQSDWHEFRCAQLEIWKNLPNSYMAVTIDLSKDWSPDNHPIHPTTKAPIGHRLARAARARVYGETNLVYSGPMIRRIDVKDHTAVLSFDHTGTGLAALDGQPLRGFYIRSEGSEFVKATVELFKDTLVISSAEVKKPWAVRYGAEADMGKEILDVNLGNREGLPASPFTMGVEE